MVVSKVNRMISSVEENNERRFNQDYYIFYYDLDDVIQRQNSYLINHFLIPSFSVLNYSLYVFTFTNENCKNYKIIVDEDPIKHRIFINIIIKDNGCSINGITDVISINFYVYNRVVFVRLIYKNNVSVFVNKVEDLVEVFEIYFKVYRDIFLYILDYNLQDYIQEKIDKVLENDVLLQHYD